MSKRTDSSSVLKPTQFLLQEELFAWNLQIWWNGLSEIWRETFFFGGLDPDAVYFASLILHRSSTYE